MQELYKAVMVPSAKVAPDAIRVLNLIRICERFNTLPRAGGLLDQDYLFVFILEKILFWDTQREELDRKKSAKTPSI